MSVLLFSIILTIAPSVTAPPRFQPPVTAPIVDHFRPPVCIWCAGNRGIDYAVAPGTPVHAAGPGRVDFAGPVGNELFVVVSHADGLRTTYAFLQSVSVSVGQTVATGDIVALAGSDLHFGVRQGDTYLDPEPFLIGRRLKARLVA
jgi:murein DD-endopeptidase MepM/ murein hydrolase activator NlpD